jgi:uncharacterized protein (UPF0333 family)
VSALRKSSCRGQTTIEYILLLGVIVGIWALFNTYFGPGLVNNVEKIVASVQSEAWTGGEKSVNEDRPFQNYYSNTQGICMQTDKAGACN